MPKRTTYDIGALFSHFLLVRHTHGEAARPPPSILRLSVAKSTPWEAPCKHCFRELPSMYRL